MEFIPYKSNESFEHSYYQIPMELFVNPKYKDRLNSDSKLLYAFLLDRLTLSQKNNWIDEENRIYLIFTREEVQEKLNLSDKTVTKSFKQLSEVKLLQEKRQGLGKPNLIYVGKIQHIEITDMENLQFLNRKNYDSGAGKNTVLDSENLRGIKPNNINTNKTNLILSNQDTMNMAKPYEQIFKNNIEYEVLIDTPANKDIIENITNIAVDTLNSKKDFVYINSERKAIETVKSQLLKINPSHIEYVINCLKENRKKVKNIKSYILTALYNSVNTMHLDSTLAARLYYE
jgi:hypothetical protein